MTPLDKLSQANREAGLDYENTAPDEVDMKLIERLRFLASGQDDPHSIALSEAADALDRRRRINDAIKSVRLFNGGLSMKEKIDAAIKHAKAYGHMQDSLWPHQDFSMTLGELLSAAKRGSE